MYTYTKFSISYMPRMRTLVRGDTYTTCTRSKTGEGTDDRAALLAMKPGAMASARLLALCAAAASWGGARGTQNFLSTPIVRKLQQLHFALDALPCASCLTSLPRGRGASAPTAREASATSSGTRRAASRGTSSRAATQSGPPGGR